MRSTAPASSSCERRGGRVRGGDREVHCRIWSHMKSMVFAQPRRESISSWRRARTHRMCRKTQCGARRAHGAAACAVGTHVVSGPHRAGCAPVRCAHASRKRQAWIQVTTATRAAGARSFSRWSDFMRGQRETQTVGSTRERRAECRERDMPGSRETRPGARTREHA